MMRKLGRREGRLPRATLRSICSQFWDLEQPHLTLNTRLAPRGQTVSWSLHTMYRPPTPSSGPGSLSPSTCGLNTPDQDSPPQTSVYCHAPGSCTGAPTPTASHRRLSQPAMPHPRPASRGQGASNPTVRLPAPPWNLAQYCWREPTVCRWHCEILAKH